MQNNEAIIDAKYTVVLLNKVQILELEKCYGKYKS